MGYDAAFCRFKRGFRLLGLVLTALLGVQNTNALHADLRVLRLPPDYPSLMMLPGGTSDSMSRPAIGNSTRCCTCRLSARGTVFAIEPGLDECVQHVVANLDRQVAGDDALTREQVLNLSARDLPDAIPREAVECDDVLKAIQQLGAKHGFQRFDRHHLRRTARRKPDRLLEGVVAADVRGRDHYRIAEVRARAVRRRNVPFVQQLQQHVPDVLVRLLDLVEQNDLEGLHANGIEQARWLQRLLRIPDEQLESVVVIELGEIETQQPRFAAEQIARERLRQLGLADAGRSDEQQTADRRFGLSQPA